ncbi:MAG: peptidoglycan DD-metalloendopeptidase family protein [Firmicutes bacterium]|nr:peptidoglycan DD-metalloendopeptidase family protein [Bacillota bacterium]
MAKWQTIIIEKLWLLGAIIIEGIDGIIDDVIEVLVSGAWGIMDLCGGIVTVIDNILDLIHWAISVFAITTLRSIHNIRLEYLQYKKQIRNGALYFIIAGVFVIWLIASVIDFSYAYNGKTLGIVKEQRDVLEILDLISDELTQEYGSPVSISGEEDITFTPVISVGKEVDNADMVLKKFTYMGDIQTSAYGFFVDGVRVGVIQSEKEGDTILETIIDKYLKKKRKSYEYVGIVEDVEVKEVETTLSKINSKSAVVRIIEAGTMKETLYTTEKGDTFKDIAKELGVSAKDLKELNEGLADVKTFEEGQTIISQKVAPILTVKTIGKETFAEVVKYKTETIESDDYFEGEEFVRQEGQDGKQVITARVTRLNGELAEREDLKTEVIQEPVNKIIVKGTRKEPLRAGTGTFIRPVNVAVYSGFGWRWGRQHEGIDLATSWGTPIHAADGGTVTRAGWYGAYGLCVDIDHGGGVMTRYGHCSSLLVSVGDRVYQGQTIAKVGSTGRSTGPHCHFEIRINGTAVNPTNYV